MMSSHRLIPRRTVPSVVILLAGAALTWSPAAFAQVAQGAARPMLTPELERVRATLDKYQDPIVAVRDGYFSTLGCVEYPTASGHGEIEYKPGGMGVHFLNTALIGPALDPAKPQVLIYEPDGDKLRLVAAEWFVPTAVSKEAPQIFGRNLEGPMMGHEPLIPESLHHWDLHVWLWKHNPYGVFSPTNPTIKCPSRAYSFKEKPPKLLKH